jgi:hypothetical protein
VVDRSEQSLKRFEPFAEDAALMGLADLDSR